MILELDFVAKEATDATEALHELETFLGFVGDEFNAATEVHVVVADPLGQWLLVDDVVVGTSLLILEQLGVLLLGGCQKKDLLISLNRVLELIASHFEVLEEHHSL